MIPFPNKKYQIIYADPPWEYDNSRDPINGGISYPSLSIKEICNLPVKEITDEDCALVLWATMPKLPEAIQVIDSWGFNYITCLFNWIKLNPNGKGIYSGLGHWTNGNAELVLFGKKGHPKRYAYNIKQIQFAPRGRHSVKPLKIAKELIRLFGDLPRIELFARIQYPGWDAWGNEVVTLAEYNKRKKENEDKKLLSNFELATKLNSSDFDDLIV